MQLTHFPEEQTCDTENKHWRCHRVQTAGLNKNISMSSLLREETRLWLTRPDTLANLKGLCVLNRKHDHMVRAPYSVKFDFLRRFILRNK